MIYFQSRDYTSGRVTLEYTGLEPSMEEIQSYCQHLLGFTPASIVVTDPADIDTDWDCMQIEEMGIIYCYPSSTRFLSC